MVSVRLVVVGIENTAQNNDSGPRHAHTSLHNNGDPGTRIELNLVTEIMRAAVDLRRIPPIPCKTVSNVHRKLM